MSTSNEAIAKEILNAVGGAANVISVENCMTRLRFNLKDASKANKESLESMDGVKGVVVRGEQYQVVMGSQSADIYKILIQSDSISAADAAAEETPQKIKGESKLFDRILDTIVGSVTPIIPIIMTGGLLQAVAILLSTIHVLNAESDTYQLIMFIGQAAFYFLPIFLGYSAAKKMNTSIVLGMLLGATLLYPDLAAALSAEEGFHVLGLTVPSVSYGSSVLPILLGVWVMSYVEKLVDRVMIKTIKNLLTPLVTILIMVPVTLLVLGPIGGALGNYLATFFNFLANSNMGWLAVMIMAGLAPIFVMTGMHIALIPLILNSFANSGFDSMILPGFLAFNTAAGAVALAVAVKTKNKELKATAFSASLSGYLGITEPSLYGIALRLKRPMVGLIGGGAIAGLLAGFMHFKVYVFITAGLLALPSYIDEGNNFLAACLIILTSTIATFLITYFYGFEDIEEK